MAIRWTLGMTKWQACPDLGTYHPSTKFEPDLPSHCSGTSSNETLRFNFILFKGQSREELEIFVLLTKTIVFYRHGERWRTFGATATWNLVKRKSWYGFILSCCLYLLTYVVYKAGWVQPMLRFRSDSKQCSRQLGMFCVLLIVGASI